MEAIVDLLRAIRSRFEHAVETGEIHLGAIQRGKQFYEIRSDELAQWMDATRAEVLALFGGICEQAALPRVTTPRSLGRCVP